jgi:ABC-2 type transport system ATP-binding protein
VGSVSLVDVEDGRRTLRIFPDDATVPIVERVIATASGDGVGIASVFVEQGRLDDVFRDITAP